jgi:hypothetical protein
MPGKPNFDAQRIILKDQNVFVNGSSATDDAADAADIVGITVYLAQGDRIDEKSAAPNDPWVVVFDLADTEGNAQDFQLGPAVAFGVERRKTNHTTTVWAQAVEIRPEPN